MPEGTRPKSVEGLRRRLERARPATGAERCPVLAGAAGPVRGWSGFAGHGGAAAQA